MPKKELILSEETAQAQLELFLDWYGMDYDDMFKEDGVSEKADKARSAIKKLLFQRLRQGYMEFKEETGAEGESSLIAIQHLDYAIHGSSEIKYNEIRGRHRAAVKTVEEENDTAQAYRLLGMLTGEGHKFFDNLRGADIGVADILGYLFLLV